MKKRVAAILFAILFITGTGSLGHARMSLSAESPAFVSGTVENDADGKSVASFSARQEDEMLTLTIDFHQKTLSLRKAPNELYVTSESTEGKYQTLEDREKKILRDLARSMSEHFGNDDPFHRKLVCLLQSLASWPPGMPLAVSMDFSTITIGDDSVSRRVLDDLRYRSLSENLESSMLDELDPGLRPEDWVSLCGRIGKTARACYPKRLFPSAKYKCERVLVGGTVCRGRCGTECEGLCDGARYTQECLNHDRCADVYGLTHRFCNFIFPACFDDCDDAVDCDDVPGTWILTFDWGCDQTSGATNLYIYPNHVFKTDDGATGRWAMSGSSVMLKIKEGCIPVYRGQLTSNRLSMSGTMQCKTSSDTGCWSAVKTDDILPTLGSVTGESRVHTGGGSAGPE